jgi:hypothetical protein
MLPVHGVPRMQSARRFVSETSKAQPEPPVMPCTWLSRLHPHDPCSFDPHDHKEMTMIKRTSVMAALVWACAGAATLLPAGHAQAAEAGVKCNLAFNLSGWSLIYKHAEGSGTITCDNGQHSNVKIEVVGGGLTAGKYHIDHGKGQISNVHSIADVYGDYVQAGAEAGVVKSSTAQVLTKGTTSLALAGTGEGINLGVSVGKFTISQR